MRIFLQFMFCVLVISALSGCAIPASAEKTAALVPPLEKEAAEVSLKLFGAAAENVEVKQCSQVSMQDVSVLYGTWVRCTSADTSENAEIRKDGTMTYNSSELYCYTVEGNEISIFRENSKTAEVSYEVYQITDEAYMFRRTDTLNCELWFKVD